MTNIDVSFWKDFLSNGLSTIIGALIGIPIALWIDRIISSREKRLRYQEENLIQMERRKQLLNQLYFAIAGNITLLQEISKKFVPNAIIYFNVDHSQLDATSTLKYDLLPDLKLNAMLDANRFRLMQYAKLIDFHRRVYLDNLSELSTNIQLASQVDSIRKEILRQIPALNDELGETEKRILNELNSLP